MHAEESAQGLDARAPGAIARDFTNGHADSTAGGATLRR